jgi:hypothetical protein
MIFSVNTIRILAATLLAILRYLLLSLFFFFFSRLFQSPQPPKDLLIEVRVVEDCGTVMTESGSVSLNRGSILFLRRYKKYLISVPFFI